jgi:uncharacterized membrane protein
MPRKKKKTFVQQFNLFETKLADAITRWSGSMPFVYLHTVWFALWLIFLPKMVELLTLIVSLEAIYLSTFILVSQRREREITEERELEEEKEDQETQEDLIEIQTDVEGIEKDVDEIQADVEGIEQDVDTVQKDMEEIKKLILRIEDRLSSTVTSANAISEKNATNRTDI